MRVAVVGATGTIGRPLAEALSAEHEVIGVARTPAATAEGGVVWIAADATDECRRTLHLILTGNGQANDIIVMLGDHVDKLMISSACQKRGLPALTAKTLLNNHRAKTVIAARKH